MKVVRTSLAVLTGVIVVSVPTLFAVFHRWAKWPLADRQALFGGWVGAAVVGCGLTALAHHRLQLRLQRVEEAAIRAQLHTTLGDPLAALRDARLVADASSAPAGGDRGLDSTSGDDGDRIDRPADEKVGVGAGIATAGPPTGAPTTPWGSGPTRWGGRRPQLATMRRASMAAAGVFSLVIGAIVAFDVVNGPSTPVRAAVQHQHRPAPPPTTSAPTIGSTTTTTPAPVATSTTSPVAPTTSRVPVTTTTSHSAPPRTTVPTTIPAGRITPVSTTGPDPRIDELKNQVTADEQTVEEVGTQLQAAETLLGADSDACNATPSSNCDALDGDQQAVAQATQQLDAAQSTLEADQQALQALQD
jgi:hypothetical protein